MSRNSIAAPMQCVVLLTGVPLLLSACIATNPPAAEPTIPQSWVVACAPNEFCMAIDPDGNFYSGSGRTPDFRFVYRLARPEKPEPAKKRSWGLSCAPNEWCTAVDNEGNLYAGSMRTPDIAFKYKLKPK